MPALCCLARKHLGWPLPAGLKSRLLAVQQGLQQHQTNHLLHALQDQFHHTHGPQDQFHHKHGLQDQFHPTQGLHDQFYHKHGLQSQFHHTHGIPSIDLKLLPCK